MAHRPDLPKRKTIRARMYDYSSPGAYFVTICVKDRHPYFGTVRGDGVELSPAGQVVESTWLDLPNRFDFLELDSYVVMPNHFHGILAIVSSYVIPPIITIDDEAQLEARIVGAAGVINHAPTRCREQMTGHAPVALGEVIRTFKAVATRLIRANHDPTFAWQRNYYEHIIGSDRSLDRLHDYIDGNPALWDRDSLFMPELGRQ